METNTVWQALNLLAGDAAVITLILVLLYYSSKKFRGALETKSSIASKIAVGAVFGLLAVYGTLGGNEIDGAVLNVRDQAPMIAGFLGGPVVGLAAGLVGGVQRFAMGGFTATSCSLATILSGTFAGLLAEKIKGKHFLFKTLVLAACLELLHMILILTLAQPTDKAVLLMQKIALPMTVANALGVACAIYLINKKRVS